MSPLITAPRTQRYRVTWQDDTTRRQRTFTSALDAHRFRATRARAPRGPAVADLLRDWASHRAWATATRKRVEHLIDHLIEPHFGHLPADTLTPEEIRAWVRWLDQERSYSPATIRRHFCVLRAALTWAADTQIIPTNPCAAMNPPRVPRAERATALTRLTPQTNTPPAHHRRHRPLTELRQIILSTATTEELTTYLRRINLTPTTD